MAATWDARAARRVGDVVATEARAKFNAQAGGATADAIEGLTIWSPNINIFRDPRWGRGQETYGEDPYLTGRLGVALHQRVAGPRPALPQGHRHAQAFRGAQRPRSRARRLRRRSLAARPGGDLPARVPRSRVTEGKARSLMCAYNAIHGVPACASSPLLIDRLRRDWGFKGFTVSDCDAVANISLLPSLPARRRGRRGGRDQGRHRPQLRQRPTPRCPRRCARAGHRSRDRHRADPRARRRAARSASRSARPARGAASRPTRSTRPRTARSRSRRRGSRSCCSRTTPTACR